MGSWREGRRAAHAGSTALPVVNQTSVSTTIPDNMNECKLCLPAPDAEEYRVKNFSSCS